MSNWYYINVSKAKKNLENWSQKDAEKTFSANLVPLSWVDIGMIKFLHGHEGQKHLPLLTCVEENW